MFHRWTTESIASAARNLRVLITGLAPLLSPLTRGGEKREELCELAKWKTTDIPPSSPPDVSTSIQLHNNVRPGNWWPGPDSPLIGGRRIIVIMFSRDFAWIYYSHCSVTRASKAFRNPSHDARAPLESAKCTPCTTLGIASYDYVIGLAAVGIPDSIRNDDSVRDVCATTFVAVDIAPRCYVSGEIIKVDRDLDLECVTSYLIFKFILYLFQLFSSNGINFVI